MGTYKLNINGNDYVVDVQSVAGQTAKVNVNGVDYDVRIEGEAAAPAPAPVQAAPQPAAAPAARETAPAAAPAGGKTVTSPLPGVIISVDVAAGQAVKKGQKLAVLEAMKMENEILSSVDGTVTKVFVQKGDSVLEGANIVSIG